jgi:hypothetical protein
MLSRRESSKKNLFKKHRLVATIHLQPYVAVPAEGRIAIEAIHAF